MGAVIVNGRLLPAIQGFPFGEVADDVNKHNFFYDVFVGKDVGTGGAHVASAYNGYFAHVF
jgi:hypothetical protein